MADAPMRYQPGVMLHNAIVGAFRARGMTFENWLSDNDITPAAARQATFGQSGGQKGEELRARLIEAAGAETVRAGYLAALRDHTDDVLRARKVS